MTATDYISIKDASEFLGVSIRTIQRYIKSKRIKYKHINGKTIIFRSSLDSLKDDVEILKSTHEKEVKIPPAPDFEPKSFEIGLVRDSLDILRDQLRAKDDQIKELSSSVKELQSTQKLLIEKGLNLTALPSMSQNYTNELKTDIDQNEPKVVNVSIDSTAPEKETLASVLISKDKTVNSTEIVNKGFLIAIISVSAILVFVALILLLFKY